VKLKENFSTFTAQFPDFKGEKSTEGALNYIADLFYLSLPSAVKKSQVYHHSCCALDTELVDKVFTQARGQLAQRTMASTGL